MNVSLTPELERLVSDKVQSGLYASASEVVREALRLLQDRDEQRRTQQEELRREIRIGLDQLANGQCSTYDESTLPSLAAEIRTEGRRRRAQKQNGAA